MLVVIPTLNLFSALAYNSPSVNWEEGEWSLFFELSADVQNAPMSAELCSKVGPSARPFGDLKVKRRVVAMRAASEGGRGCW